MAQPPPFRSRPNLRLSLTPLFETPSLSTHTTPFPSPSFTPSVATKYSPFRSAGLKPPTPSGGLLPHASKSSRQAAKPKYRKSAWFRIRRVFASRLLPCLLSLIGFSWWLGRGWKEELDIVKISASEFGLGTQLFKVEATKDLQFFPAANPKIHYVGRWTSTPNRLRKDGTFPGVYFDLNITNTTTLLLSLRNAPRLSLADPEDASPSAISLIPDSNLHSNPSRLTFRHSLLLDVPAPPVSLLARVDQEEYVLLPNSSVLVNIRSNDLDPHQLHQIRIIAPMTDDYGKGLVQLEGIWLSKGGKLLRVKGALFERELEDEDEFNAQSDKIGEKHRLGLSSIMGDTGRRQSEEKLSKDEEAVESLSIKMRKKLLEVITDSPGSINGKGTGRRTGGADGLLAGVMGWEYLLGDMFDIDHVSITVDGMCLVQDCMGGTGELPGMGDVFFRSGPPGSPYFEHPWLFHAHVPDVLVFNLGGSDYASFEAYEPDYNRTLSELSESFEDTYVSLVRAVRRMAYPKHPTIVQAEKTGRPDFNSDNAFASIPIFIMRPFRGQLEHATQGAVNRLRADGDKFVFWLDTSGWLDVGEDAGATQDFFLDESVASSTWRLTEQGNQRVAIFLHMHVCRYLAYDHENCAFLPPGVYQGKVYDPQTAAFDRYIDGEKERKLKKLFWDTEEENIYSDSGSVR